MKDELRARLLAAFQAEHREHLEAVRAALAEVGDDADAVATPIQRRMHTLKGAARACDLRSVEALTHRLENVFVKVQSRERPLDGPCVSLVHRCLDAIEDHVAAVADGGTPSELDVFIKAVDDFLAGKVDEDSDSLPAAASTQSLAAPEEASGSDVAAPQQPADQAAALRGSETVRIQVSSLDTVLKRTADIITNSARLQELRREHQALIRAIENLQVAARREASKSAAGGGAQDGSWSRRVVEDLGAISVAAKSLGDKQTDAVWRLRQDGRQLQHDVTLLRTVPADTVFGGLRKVIRDVAAQEGKEVEVRLEGMQTEADRLVLQALSDPVLHIVRNAVSHGIETPKERRAAGKTIAGQVRVIVSAQGRHLVVRVRDDGRGINFERIREVARERGLLSADEAEAATQDQLLRLVVEPAFSTAGTVTEVSGRGVGLSVALEAARQLQGEFFLRPASPHGSEAVLMVPLAISTRRMLLVNLGELVFAVPSDSVERLYTLDIEAAQVVEGALTIQLGKDSPPLRLARLGSLLGQPEGRDGGDTISVMVVQSGVRRLGIAVTAFGGVADGLIRSLEDIVPSSESVSGATLLPDGTVVPVLNTAALADAALSTHIEAGGQVAERQKAAKRTVLVVDDSITTRTLEKSVLEQHGFNVRIGVDGQDALRSLNAGGIDVVVSDVEMPNLDGFGLVAAMRRDPRFANIPVILVTSLSSEDDRRRGLDLGASAYITKQRFDQRELVETIEQIL